MSRLLQSTARSKVVFMTDSTDHVTGKTGLTLTITASKDGGSFASITPTVTELATGWYKLALTSSHTDTVGDLALHITGTGADPTDVVWEVESKDLFSNLTGDAYTRLGAPAGASVSADIAAVKADTAAILIDTAEIGAAGAGLTALASQASVNTIDDFLDTEVAAILAAVDTEVAAIKAKTDNLPASPAAVGSAMTLTSAYDFAQGTVAMTEAYAADGAAPTPAQILYMIYALLAEKSVASTTMTVKKLDGTTTAMTFTLNDAVSPTSITRAT